jgi:hypothetical protein
MSEMIRDTMSKFGDNDNIDTVSNVNPASSSAANPVSPDSKHSEWTEENEQIMVEWCDVAQCYKWLNTRAHAKYSYMHAWFTIPAIVLSTISGTASFAQTSLPTAYQSYSPMAIGTINIFIGILTTVQQYLKISELNEAHRVSSISWDKFARNIRIELAKKPEERMRCEHFLKLNRQEFDRLMETSPLLSESIIAEFEQKFKDKPGFKELRKPDICNVITSADKTRYHKIVDQNKPIESYDIDIDPEVANSKNALIEVQQQKLKEKDDELKKKVEEESQRIKREIELLNQSRKDAKTAEEKYQEKIRPIHEYIVQFQEIHERSPLTDEIFDNMKEDVDIVALKRFLDSYSPDNEV